MSFSLVHQTNVGTITNAVPFTITATTIGDALTVVIANESNNPTVTGVSSITGGGVGVWVKGGSNVTGGTTNWSSEVWYGIVTSGTSNTSVTVNHNLPAASGFSSEYSWSGGTPTGITVEAGTAGVNGHSAISTAISSGVITPTSGLDAVILIVWGRNGVGATKTSGPNNGFTELTGSGSNTTCAYLLVPSTSGSYSSAWAYTNNYALHNAVIVALSISGSPPPPSTYNAPFFAGN